tara:strand:- start:2908 stop:4779 length:1872 start_codon:yes stop_codon:yes gene_type:complete
VISLSNKLINFIYAIPIELRRLVLLGIDLFNIICCLYIVSILLSNSPIIFSEDTGFIFFNSVLGILIFLFTGQYKGITRYAGSSSVYYLFFRSFLFIFFFNLSYLFVKKDIFPINFSFTYLITLTISNSFIRFALRDFLYLLSSKNKEIIAIYGAKQESIQLASALKFNSNYQIICFIDNHKSLENRYLNSVPVLSEENFRRKFSKKGIKKILIPDIIFKKSEKFLLVNKFSRYGFNVIRVPSLSNVISGESQIDSLSPVSIDELLGRDIVKPKDSLLWPGIKNHCVLITGAGGSIGSELTNLITSLDPKMLIILDQSEYNLYQIDKFIRSKNRQVKIKSILGSCMDKVLLTNLFKEYKIDVIYHAAAYKHVHIVEKNPISGILNNVFSTLTICELAFQFNIKQFVFISSDKAVRPTNIMGATKRLSEMIVQSLADKVKKEEKVTIFSSVRFGNVLGSSGSVIPLFKEQIKSGGPLTITHEEVTRYFMTIEEAAQLVIQSSVLAKGGDVFILDMGKPIKIIDLAEQMIHLSGFTIKDKNNVNGEIEIKITGLKDGEKLYEELLIGESSESTIHPLIFKANEKFIKYQLLKPKLEELFDQLKKKDVYNTKKILREIVPEWVPSS